MKECILNFLKDNCLTDRRYIGGGDEPEIVVFPESEDWDINDFLDTLAERLSAKLKESVQTKSVQWINVSDRKPLAYAFGHWDGKKSDTVLAEDSAGTRHLVTYYEGILDGTSFEEWYDANDFEVLDIVKYMILE